MDPYCIVGAADRSRSASATPDEIVVCQILLDLKTTIVSLSEILSNFNWGRRRRRSCVNSPPPLPPAPSRLSASAQKFDAGVELRRPHIKAEKVDVAADVAVRTTASPDTPLSFSPSESDDKSKRPSTKKTSKKRSREELTDIIQELNQRKELLMGEVENVRKYYHKLKAYNSELKAIKQEVVNSCPAMADSQMAVNSGPESSQHHRLNALSGHPPLIDDRTVPIFQHPFGPIPAQQHGLGSVNRVAPLGIDLNIPAEETFHLDPSRPLDVSRALADRRARFAEARRRRRGLIKIKALRSACGIKLPAAR